MLEEGRVPVPPFVLRLLSNQEEKERAADAGPSSACAPDAASHSADAAVPSAAGWSGGWEGEWEGGEWDDGSPVAVQQGGSHLGLWGPALAADVNSSTVRAHVYARVHTRVRTLLAHALIQSRTLAHADLHVHTRGCCQGRTHSATQTWSEARGESARGVRLRQWLSARGDI
eukprot:1658069-Pleurochrysis_carterae.AAC.1